MTDTDTLTNAYKRLRDTGLLQDIGERLAKEILNGNFVREESGTIASRIEVGNIPEGLQDTRHFRYMRLHIAMHCGDYLEQFDNYSLILSASSTISWDASRPSVAIITSHVAPAN